MWEAVCSHAVEAYPEECCGALVGNNTRVEEGIRLANTSTTDRRVTYHVAAEELLRATEQARERGLRILAIYHSHPDAEPCFSKEDAANACPWYGYLVVSVNGKRAAAARYYQPDSFTETEFTISGAESAE